MSDARPRQFVIIGNGIAGTSAAEVIRKADISAEITIIAGEPYPLYNRIALPPFLKRKVTAQKVMIRDMAWHERMAIILRLSTWATSVHPEEKCVQLSTGESIPYDALLIATGSRANPCPAGHFNGVYNFQTLDDAKAIEEHVSRAQSAVAFGGSYISYELCEAFRMRGLETTWLMRGPYFLRRALEPEGGAMVDAIAESHGVQMIHGEEVASFESNNGDVTGVITTTGRRIAADIVGIGLGVQRNVEFLAGSRIEIGKGVRTNEKLETNVPGVYSAGDCAEFFDTYLQMHNLMGTWDNGVSQGRLAGRNMLGGDEALDEVPTYATTLFHNRIVAFGATPESVSDVEDVWAIDRAEETYRRLFFRGYHLVGGVLIGDKRGRPKFMQMIRERTRIPPDDRTELLALQ